MKGYRTLILNGIVVVGTATLTWVSGVNWIEHFGPSAALIIVSGANIGLRLLTTTPVGKK